MRRAMLMPLLFGLTAYSDDPSSRPERSRPDTDRAHGGPDAADVARADPSGVAAPADDADGDGFTPEQGDCNDRSDEINPGALDVMADGIDGDCQDGDATAAEVECEDALELDSPAAEDAARALGLCRLTTESS